MSEGSCRGARRGGSLGRGRRRLGPDRTGPHQRVRQALHRPGTEVGPVELGAAVVAAVADLDLAGELHRVRLVVLLDVDVQLDLELLGASGRAGQRRRTCWATASRSFRARTASRTRRPRRASASPPPPCLPPLKTPVTKMTEAGKSFRSWSARWYPIRSGSSTSSTARSARCPGRRPAPAWPSRPTPRRTPRPRTGASGAKSGSGCRRRRAGARRGICRDDVNKSLSAERISSA